MGNNPTVPDNSLDEAPERWHETGELADGTPVGRNGASWYILDQETGEPLSDGWHEIRPQSEVGVYRVKSGATEKVIRL